MTVTLNPHTETLLQEQACLFGEEARELVDILVLEALEARRQEYEETCQAIAEGLTDMNAGRTIPFEEVRARWEADKAACRLQSSVIT